MYKTNTLASITLAIAIASYCIATTAVAHAEKMTMTLGEADELANGIATFTRGRPEVLHDSSGKDSLVYIPFKGLSATTTMLLAKDVNALKTEVVPYQEALQRRRLELSDKKGDISPENQIIFLDENNKLRTKQIEVELLKIPYKDLKPEAPNDIPASYIAPLMKIISE